MDRYIEGTIFGSEEFMYKGHVVRAVKRIKSEGDPLDLVVLDMGNKEGYEPVPTSERIEVAMAIRGNLLGRINHPKINIKSQAVYQMLFDSPISFINVETDVKNTPVHRNMIYAHTRPKLPWQK